MTSQTQKGNPTGTIICTADDVEAYLVQHPEFFADNPQLLTNLEVPHPSGKAVSLIERQVALIRQENKQLRGRIKELVEIAKDNENLITKLHNLSVALIETQNVEQFVASLNEKLVEDFDAFDVNIKLYKNCFNSSSASTNFIDRKNEKLKCFNKFLNHTNPVCGRFTQEQVTFLFPDNVAEIKSMALVPLIADEPLGLFAIASDNTDRYKAGMSTSFLSSLSDVAAAVLQRFKN